MPLTITHPDRINSGYCRTTDALWKSVKCAKTFRMISKLADQQKRHYQTKYGRDISASLLKRYSNAIGMQRTRLVNVLDSCLARKLPENIGGMIRNAREMAHLDEWSDLDLIPSVILQKVCVEHGSKRMAINDLYNLFSFDTEGRRHEAASYGVMQSWWNLAGEIVSAQEENRLDQLNLTPRREAYVFATCVVASTPPDTPVKVAAGWNISNEKAAFVDAVATEIEAALMRRYEVEN